MKNSLTRKLFAFASLVLISISLSACIDETEKNGNNGTNDVSVPSSNDPSRYSPYNSSEYIGMDFNLAKEELLAAGFSQISTTSIDDITSYSDTPDGAIESVTIDGYAEYTTQTKFDKDSAIVIVYHNIPKIASPLATNDVRSSNYMDVGKAFFDAGFQSIETDEVYDLEPDNIPVTQLTANGHSISAGEQLPFDSKISVVCHYPVPEYTVKIDIDFETNLLFNKYDVIVTLDSSELGTLPYGEDASFTTTLTPGEYTLSFTHHKKDDVFGSVTFTINSATSLCYKIDCQGKAVSVKETSFTESVGPGKLSIPFSYNHYLRKNYKTVVSELKKLGFTNISAEPTTESLWHPSDASSVISISIASKTAFEKDTVFATSSPVKVFYHVADYAFEETNISVTEQDSFELAYTLTSGDAIETLLFEIDNTNVLCRNDDGTYTALIPGTATISVFSGDHLCSTCVVNVSEIIVPIESLSFTSAETEVVVGNTFSIDYSINPANANYTDILTVISSTAIESLDDGTFYATEPGDAEIAFYQDERLLGVCTVHSIFVDVENLIFGELPDTIYIGDNFNVSFTLAPENATRKDIKVTSSNPEIADIFYNDREQDTIAITALSAGKATIAVTVPNGTQYTQAITVREIDPTEITISNPTPQKRIEVGDTLSLNVAWIPENTSVKDLTWKSSNSKVIKAGDDGTIEAIGVGTAEITATHKSGLTTTFSLTVEPTLVTKVTLSSDWDSSKSFYVKDKLTISATIQPQSATNTSLSYSSSDTSVAKVSEKGVVTAVGVGTATITATSVDGPSGTITVTVSPSPQKFKITWSASLISSNHVGNSWSKSFEVNDEKFSSGSTIKLDPGSSFTICLTITEADTRPDTGSYYERITYSADLCKNGYSISDTIYVRENGGRYSGNQAEWKISIKITPVS